MDIAMNNAQAQVAPLRELAKTLAAIKEEGGSQALQAYVRNLRVPLLRRAGPRCANSKELTSNIHTFKGITMEYMITGFIVGLIVIPIALAMAKGLGIYTVVNEREAQVFTLFGKVIGTIHEPGLRFPIAEYGPKALLIPFFGKKHIVSTALRQHYLRGQMVNSEEGTPMGVGIWYEMQVNDPVAYLFANTNPEGSLQANVASSTISTLSNLEMDKMLEDRHSLSRTVRATVSPLSEKWGYRLGSVYIRKVYFTDQQMVHNITDKVVKRLVPSHERDEAGRREHCGVDSQ